MILQAERGSLGLADVPRLELCFEDGLELIARKWSSEDDYVLRAVRGPEDVLD